MRHCRRRRRRRRRRFLGAKVERSLSLLGNWIFEHFLRSYVFLCLMFCNGLCLFMSHVFLWLMAYFFRR